MLISKTLIMLRSAIRHWRQEDKRIALVPTMGNLHNGHLMLVDEAREHADIVVVSIFVNPMQFDRDDDLERYPRTLQDDCEKLKCHHVNLVFTPSLVEIYPKGLGSQTFVEVPGLSSLLEGTNRPGHFRGVATIVSKLFNLVQPDIACFGDKDFQQLAIIRKMVKDMSFDIDIISVPTVRDNDGLALSSRNIYLTSDERHIAIYLRYVMHDMAKRLSNGEQHVDAIIKNAEAMLRKKGFRPDGLAICDSETLQPLTVESQHAVILMAAWLGHTRLIDNQQVDLTTNLL